MRYLLFKVRNNSPIFKEVLTEHLRREELESEFLELRSKMQEIYRSWHLSSWDQVGRRSTFFHRLFHTVVGIACGQPAGFVHISFSTF